MAENSEDLALLREDNARLRSLLRIHRGQSISLPARIEENLNDLRLRIAYRMAPKEECYQRFERPLKQALWAARELGERVLVITLDQKSIDECGRLLRSCAADHNILPSVTRRDYTEFANRGSIRIITVGNGDSPLVGSRIDSIIEVL